MTIGEYRVRIETFEGPLDLLLYLVRRAEVDIHDIPVATIADQYLEHLRGIERVDIETAGDFLLMASTLMELKSRMLVPPERSEGDDDASTGEAPGDQAGDPRADLVRQLLEYKKYRDAALALERRLGAWSLRYPGGGAALAQPERASSDADEVDLDELELPDLVRAFARIIEAVNFDALGSHEVLDDDTPTELHAEDLVDLLARRGAGPEAPMPLERVFEGRRRGEMIGLFIALLELVRQQRVGVEHQGSGVGLWLVSDSDCQGGPEPS